MRRTADQRRQQLVEAAIVVMTRDGVRRATTRAICTEAGTSLSVFHYCFASKQALLEEVVRTIVGRTATLASGAITELVAAASPQDRVRVGLRAYFDHVRSSPAEHLLTYEVTQHCLRDEELRDVARHQYELYGAEITRLMHSVGLPEDADVTVLARYLAVVVDGTTADWLARRDDATAEAVLDAAAAHVTALLPLPG